MAFSDYISSLPNQREETIKKIAEITCSDISSVYRWINRKATPPPIKQKVIAEYFKMSIEELFPEEKEDKND